MTLRISRYSQGKDPETCEESRRRLDQVNRFFPSPITGGDMEGGAFFFLFFFLFSAAKFRPEIFCQFNRR